LGIPEDALSGAGSELFIAGFGKLNQSDNGEGTVMEAESFDSPGLSVNWERGLSKTPKARVTVPRKQAA
jgi:hypothetical protein